MKALGYKSLGANFDTIERRLKEYNISIEHFTGLTQGRTERTPENVFIKDSTATQAVLRRMYLKGNYSEYKCAICGLEPIWNGKPLTLTLDHIDGDHHNDTLENLRWICPNCDRQLPTFAGRNTKSEDRYNYSPKKEVVKEEKISNKPSREELKKQIRILPFTKVAENFNITDNAVRKWCKSYSLPHLSREIKKISDKAKKEGINLINIPIRHLGTEKAHELYKKLENQEEVDKVNMKLRRLNKKIKELKNGQSCGTPLKKA